MEIPIKLQVFEGPMDLLMHLLEKNKIDIFDIPIVTITDQYLEYVRQMENSDMDITSEFLVMASTLLDIKSRMLLPREETDEEEQEDPREELVRRLLEYKMYKTASEELRDRSIEAGQRFFREQDLPEEVKRYIPPIQYEELIGDTTMDSLRDIFAEVLRRKKSRVDPVRSGFREIPKEEVSAAAREKYIREYLREHKRTEFRSLLEAESSKEEVIVTFLVILELIKLQEIRITQETIGGEILIEVVEDRPSSDTVRLEAVRPDVAAELTEELPEPEEFREEPQEPEELTEELPEPEECAEEPEETAEKDEIRVISVPQRRWTPRGFRKVRKEIRTRKNSVKLRRQRIGFWKRRRRGKA